MTREEHYKKAEEYLKTINTISASAKDAVYHPRDIAQINATIDLQIKLAQVHATLATTSDGVL